MAQRVVGKLAKIDFEGVRRGAEHVDIRAGAKDSRLQTGNHDGTYLGMFKANSLNRVGQLDINSKVIRVEFQLVTIAESLVFLYVHRQGSDLSVKAQAPVFILFP